MRTSFIRAALALGVILAVSSPAAAQSIVRGKVLDAGGKPVEGAAVTIEGAGANRRAETKTNRNGEFSQIGLATGAYTITVVKDSLKSVQTANISLARPTELSITLSPTSGLTPEQIKANAEMQAMAVGAIEDLRAGRNDDAIRRFNEIIVKVPSCSDCYYNMGIAYSKTQKFSEAEAAFQKAIEMAPNSGEAYTGLANVYNAQKKFDLAQQASSKAAELAAASGGGGNAEAAYNQGVILFNGQKYAEAKVQFEAAVKADASMAPAQLQLGLSNLNLGALPEAASAFEAYLTLDPDGAKLPANAPLKIADLKAFVASQKP